MKTRKHKHPAKGIRTKWFRRVGHFSVFKKPGGDIYIAHHEWGSDEYHLITDGAVMDMFIWLGRYLAEKKKLPRHLALNEIAIRAGRIPKDIHAVMANETYQLEILRNNPEEYK